MNKKSYSKILADIYLFNPEVIRNSISTMSGLDEGSDKVDELLITVLEKYTPDNLLNDLSKEISANFTDKEMEIVLTYLKFIDKNFNKDLEKLTKHLFSNIILEIEKVKNV